MNPNLMALLSAALFAVATIGFTHLSKRTSSWWINAFKACVGTLGFFLAANFLYGWHTVSIESLVAFLMSGAIGLGLADVFLFKAFLRIGPSRTLMLFGFSPLINGIFSYYFFSQALSPQKLLAIVFLILCLFTFSYESFRKEGAWEFKGLFYAFVGVVFDCSGILLSRYAFNHSPSVTPIEGNFYRGLSACVFLFMVLYFLRQKPLTVWFRLNTKDRSIAFISSFLGTFLSLWIFLSAIQVGHLATISGIAVTAPFIAAAFEAALFRQLPSRYFWLASFFFVLGSAILLL